MKRLLLTLLVFYASRLFGQVTPNPGDYSKLAEIIPPAPNAASLGKYGGIEFGLSTGTLSQTIPIYQYSSSNITVPISINYSSNGVKVDEIASRVGMSWSLNTGGVITRTVYGRADEMSTRLKPPSDFPLQSTNLISFMDNLALSNLDGGTSDAQPDIFSFNFYGYSGKFILDSSYNALLLSHTDIKITMQFDSSSWNIKMISQDGVQYFFGGDSAIETTSNNQVGVGCGKGAFSAVPTAYYLKRIIHPNNDTVNFIYSRFGFTYKSGTVETMYGLDPSYHVPCPTGDYQPGAPNLSNTTCLSQYTNSGVSLNEINSTSGGKVKFYYSSRTDGVDKALTKIEIYQPDSTSTPIRVFSFLYNYSRATSFGNGYSTSDTTINYRLFLSKFIERSADSSLLKTYQFYYNDINGLPPRLSFAQDDYGIFNGKNNTTLVPKPTYLIWQAKIPDATANRSADPIYGVKGLLSKIVYPTGGSDTIYYESNTVYTSVPNPLPDSSIYITKNSGPLGGGPQTGLSDTAFIVYGQETTLYASFQYTGPENEYDPIHCKAFVRLIDLTANDTIYSNTNLTCVSNPISIIVDLQSGHSYILSVTASGHYSEVSASLSYKYGSLTYTMTNKQVGGLRVAKIITMDSVAQNQSIKKFIYADLTNQNQSSGGLVYTPQYEKYLINFQDCIHEPSGGNPAWPECAEAEYAFYTMFSYSQNNIYAYSFAPVSYRSVVESFGENFENGGIEHKYTITPGEQGNSLLGDNIIGAPLSDHSWENGREYYQNVFKKIDTNYVSLKKVYTHFRDDTRVDSTFYAYVVNKKYTPPCSGNPPIALEFDAYDLFQYSIFRKWSYVDTVRTLTYDQSGQNYIEDTAVTEYSNSTHALPTKLFSRGSDAKLNVIKNYYPQDISLSGAEETGRLAMISKHIISPKLQVEVLKDTTQVMKAKIHYNVFNNNLVLPREQYVQTLNNPSEKRIEFLKYNIKGKVIEQAKISDVKYSYIWDYNSLYPIAQVVNADSSSIAYSSFEADGKGGWTYSGAVSTDSSTTTGIKCYNATGGNITRTGLANATYIVSYWGKNGSVNVNSNGPTKSGRFFGNWRYYEHEVTTTSITVSGSNYIDELRLYPKDALMTTSTYKPLVGVTSQCDANNRISYYEYDRLGRLLIVRDQDSMIIKKICYNYAGQPENCTKFTNAVKSGSFTRNNCSCGYTGSSVTYTVPTGTYFSTVSQADADQQAQNDVNGNGQTYANANGSCTAITFYARIELANIYNDVGYSTADIYIRFYSDVSCTIPTSACGLNVNYKKVRTLCSGGSPVTTNYTANNCTGTQTYLGNFIISSDDGVHCYNYTFSTTAGTGYTPK